MRQQDTPPNEGAAPPPAQRAPSVPRFSYVDLTTGDRVQGDALPVMDVQGFPEGGVAADFLNDLARRTVEFA